MLINWKPKWKLDKRFYESFCKKYAKIQQSWAIKLIKVLKQVSNVSLGYFIKIKRVGQIYFLKISQQ